MKIKIRFNKSRGNPWRGSTDHAWRVFIEYKEYLFKHLDIQVPTKSAKEENSDEWNIICDGYFNIDREASIAIITDEISWYISY